MDATQKIHVSECDKNRYQVKSSWVEDGCPWNGSLKVEHSEGIHAIH